MSKMVTVHRYIDYWVKQTSQIGYNTFESAGIYFLLGLLWKEWSHDLWEHIWHLPTMSPAFSICRVTNSTSSVGTHPRSFSPGWSTSFNFSIKSLNSVVLLRLVSLTLFPCSLGGICNLTYVCSHLFQSEQLCVCSVWRRSL